MTALYYPRDEYDCTPESRAIEHASTQHLHAKSNDEACRMFLATFGEWVPDAFPRFGTVGMGQHERAGERAARGHLYTCVHGPGGLVRGVLP